MPSTLPPPCLSLAIPTSSKSSHQSQRTDSPALGISTYSHRVPRPRPNADAETVKIPLALAGAVDSTREWVADQEQQQSVLRTASSDWQGGDLGQPFGAPPSPTVTPFESLSQRKSNLPYLDTSSLNHESSTSSKPASPPVISLPSALALGPPKSPTGTYLSVLQPPHQIRTPNTVRPLGQAGRKERKHRRRMAAESAARAYDSTSMEAGMQADQQKELKLKSLYLCPWEAFSPSSAQEKQETKDIGLPLPISTAVHSASKIRKHGWTKLVKTLGLVLGVLLVLADLAMLNVRAFEGP